MKKFIIYMIPGLLMLNACTEGRQGLSADQAAIIENSLVSGSEDAKNDGDTTAKTPQLDGSDLPEAPPAQQPSDDDSHTLAPGAHLGNGSVTATPAFPSDNGNGHNGNDYGLQQTGPGFNFQKSNSNNPVQGIQDGNFDLAADAEDQGEGNGSGAVTGLQPTGSGPQVSETNKTLVYDPFCNCNKTSATNDGPSSVEDGKHPQVGHSNSALSSNKKDDDDSDD